MTAAAAPVLAAGFTCLTEDDRLRFLHWLATADLEVGEDGRDAVVRDLAHPSLAPAEVQQAFQVAVEGLATAAALRDGTETAANVAPDLNPDGQGDQLAAERFEEDARAALWLLVHGETR